MNTQPILQSDSVTSRFALKRVVLIDSYTEGRITELPLAGGTAITGRNGRGKTSLLRLIPAFYGERPDRIVKPVSNQKNFARYYLPRATSYIVFEYQRDDAMCCAVLCADQSGDGVEYRFISSPYQREWFVHGDEITLAANSNLLERLKLRGIRCTRKMRLDQYRAILQGKRTHGSDLKQHRRDILDYAFCPSSHTLPHIERIVFGMFMRKTDFRDLQRMIVSTVTDASVHISLGAERKKVENWPDAYQSYAAVMAESHRMENVRDAYNSVLAAEQELRNIHNRFHSLDRALEEEQLKKQRELEKEEQDLIASEQEHTIARRAILDKIDHAERCIDAISGKLKQLNQQHANYTKQSVEGKASLLDQEEEILQTRAHLESRKSVLLSQQSNIEEEYLKILDSLRLEHSERKPEFERQRSEAREAHQVRVDHLTIEFDQQEASARQVSASIEKSLQEAVDLASEAVGNAKSQLSNPQPDPILVEIVEQQEIKTEEARAKHQNAIEQEGAARKEYVIAKDAFDLTENQLRVLQGEAQKMDKKLKSLLMHASPNENSVLYVLRNEHPGWTQDIAKVLRDDILMRTDLSPVLGEIQDSVYGLRINLDFLEPPLVADESALQRQIDSTRDTLHSINDHIAQLEVVLAQCSSVRLAAENTVGLKSSASAITKSALSSAEQQLKFARADVQRSRDIARDQSQHAFVAAMHRFNEAKQQLSAHRIMLEENITTLRAHQRRRKEESQETLNLLFNDICKRETEATNRYEEARTQINNDRTVKLKTNGVDTAALEQLERQIETVVKQLKTINESRNLIVDWRRWVSIEWCQKPAHEDALATAQQERISQEESKVTFTKAWHDDQTRRERIINGLTKRLSEIASSRDQVARQRKVLEPYQVNSDVVPEYDAAWQILTLIGQTTAQFSALRMHEDRLQQDIVALKRVFTANRHSPSDQYFETQRRIIGPDRADRPREWVPAFKEWYSSEHEHYRNLLRIDAKTIAEAIGEFHDHMEIFHRKVQQFNRELLESLDSNQGFESIGSLIVEIVSSIHELEYWSIIEKVATARLDWLTVNPTDLPHPEFASALRELLNHWQLKEGIQADLTNLVRIQGEVVENNNRRPFKKAEDLETISSNGLSYIVMVLIFVGFINRIRGKAPVNVVWALDEIKDLDIGNIELLMEILAKNNITLVSACPDPDPDVLALFKNRRSIRADRYIYDPSVLAKVDTQLTSVKIEEIENV